eukprot:1918143-Amphidinium_carterae.1
MKQILRAAVQPETVISQIEPVVSSCSICRAWKRPQPRAQTSRQVPEKFNDRVQADIVWLDGQPTLHVIDKDTRYSQAVFLPSQNDVVMMEKLSEIWIKVFGPTKTLISDQEAGIKSENAGIILSRWGIVERHHEILRSAYHKIPDQTVTEGTGVSADIMLSEAVHGHNILTTKGGFTPHEAVFGRTPPALIIDTEETSHEALIGGEHSLGRIARTCEVAVRSMIECLTEDRIRRAEKSKTHQAAMELELNPGDLVVGKANPGWRGPVKVVDVSSLDRDGIAHVRWQGDLGR